MKGILYQCQSSKDRFLLKPNFIFQNTAAYSYGMGLQMKYWLLQEQGNYQIDEVAIVGSNLAAYHLSIQLRNQGYNARLFEEENIPRMNQAWVPVRDYADNERLDDAFDFLHKSTFDYYNYHIRKSSYFGLKKCKLNYEGTEEQFKQYLEQNIPIALRFKPDQEFILIEGQFINALRDEAHSLGVRFDRFISLDAIKNYHIVDSRHYEPAEIQENCSTSQLTLNLMDKTLTIPQNKGALKLNNLKLRGLTLPNPKL